jgi:hypothetical protein
MKALGRMTICAGVLAAAAAVPAVAHHSFSIFNMEQTKVLTGVVTRVNPDANHLQVFFAPMNDARRNVLRGEDGKPVIWAIEMAGSAQSAADGISVSALPPGTIISVNLHPLRSGEPAGSRTADSAVVKCPEKRPPTAGKHCDTVDGSLMLGGKVLEPVAK